MLGCPRPPLRARRALTSRLGPVRGGFRGRCSPQAWLTRQRVERARTLLEETDLPVETIAYSAGFNSATSLRQHLHAQLGVSPTAYRRTFHAAV